MDCWSTVQVCHSLQNGKATDFGQWLFFIACELHYEGSCAIDEDLLDAANFCENEQVHIWNINSGERFITYAIKGERSSSMISVNGSATRRVSVGDLLIIAAFTQVEEKKWPSTTPNGCLLTTTTNKWACATLCPRELRRATARMNAELSLPLTERGLFVLYQLATWVTCSALDNIVNTHHY